MISFSIVWGNCLESPSPGLAQVNSVPSEVLDHAHNTNNTASMSASDLMAMVNRHYGVLDRNFQLPAIPTDTVAWSSLPSTPPEALARLERTRVNARIFNRLYNEAGVYIQDQGALRHLTRLCTTRAQPTTTDEEYNELVDAHGTIGNHMGTTDKLTRS
jgi:hypothetical protein